MFPGSSSSNPFTYTNSTTLENTFENDGKGSLGQEEHLSCYSNLLAPFLEDDELLLSHLLSQQQLLFCGTSQAQTENSVAASNKATDTEKEASGNTVAEQIPSERSLTKKKSSSGTKQRDPSKRTGKKDRHSKICTAQGPRDRRMRLSLQTARKFFDLQDMLGFDKASKTIEWLFSKSMTAIKELTQNISQMKRSSSEDGAKSVSVTSDSEVVSQNVDGEQTGFVADGEIFNCITVERTNRKFHRVARDSRDKARARARERTREKLMIKGLEISQISEGPNPNNLGQLWSSRALETDRESCFRFHEAKCSLKMAAEVAETTNHLLEHQIDSVSINSKLLGFVGAPSKSSLTFNYSHNASSSNRGNCEDDLSGFPGNWVNSDDLQSLCRRTTNMKPPAGNVQVKFPAAIPTVTSRPQELKPSTMTFASTYNCQERILHSVYMTTPTAQEENPRSISITSNSQQQNPNSNNYASSNNQLYSHFLEEQFS